MNVIRVVVYIIYTLSSALHITYKVGHLRYRRRAPSIGPLKKATSRIYVTAFARPGKRALLYCPPCLYVNLLPVIFNAVGK